MEKMEKNLPNQLMTLKDLKVSLNKHKHISPNNGQNQNNGQLQNNGYTIDVDIACKIIDTMFDQISRCLQQDRSRIKVNVLTKGVVLSLLGDRTKNGMKDYLANMFNADIKDLLDDIQKELNRRQI